MLNLDSKFGKSVRQVCFSRVNLFSLLLRNSFPHFFDKLQVARFFFCKIWLILLERVSSSVCFDLNWTILIILAICPQQVAEWRVLL